MGAAMLPAFSGAEVVTRWAFGPVVTVFAVVFAAAYLAGTVAVARRHPARPWPWWRTALFLGGLAVVVLATESGIGVYDSTLVWVHMIQHLMLIMIAPAMLVAGLPITLALHACRNPAHTRIKRLVRSRVSQVITSPAFGIAAYTATITGTHLTGFMGLVMTNAAARDGEHVLYLVVGYLFFLPLIGHEPIRWKLSYAARIFVLFLTMPVDTFTGLILSYSTSPMAGMPTARPAWAPSALSDLHSAGAVMWIAGDAIMFVFMMFVFLAWSRDDRAALGGGRWLESARRSSFTGLTGEAAPGTGTGPQPAGRRDSEATIDDDEHLAAYNAFLARINAAEQQRGATRPGRPQD